MGLFRRRDRDEVVGEVVDDDTEADDVETVEEEPAPVPAGAPARPRGQSY